jgi:hypothetical protein
LDQQREEGAGNFILSSINSNEEKQQHKEDGNAQLGMDFAGFFFTDFSECQQSDDGNYETDHRQNTACY